MPVINPEFLQIIEEAKRRFSTNADPKGIGLRDWLFRGDSYYVAHSSNKKLTLEATNDTWAEANGTDIARFLWAAHDSILPRSINLYDARSISWASISTYYAGFYLTLGLLRLFGRGLIFFTEDDCKALTIPGMVKPLERGVYSVLIQPGQRASIEISKKNAGAFHEAFWRYADSTLCTIADEVARGEGPARPFSQIVRTQALSSIDELRLWLNTPSGTVTDVGWMSAVRNDINYKLSRHVWTPTYKERGITVTRLRDDIRAVLRGERERLGIQLQLDKDIRTMTERVCVFFRDFSKLSGFPKVR